MGLFDFSMSRKLFYGSRKEKVEAATAIVMWASAFGFSLSTLNFYIQPLIQPFLHSGVAENFTDDIATGVGVVLGTISGLKFTA